MGGMRNPPSSLPDCPVLETLTIADCMSLFENPVPARPTRDLDMNGLFLATCDFFKGGLYNCIKSLRLNRFLRMSSALT